MIPRRMEAGLRDLLDHSPAVALLGPRQVGKTTLALTIASRAASVYLDLESPADRARLSEPELYFEQHRDDLVVLDEIHRAPEIFRVLRGVIDRGRREGRGQGRFLLLGSAALDLLAQPGESLAGRIAFCELTAFDALEVRDLAGPAVEERLWVRGGFPESYLAPDGARSLRWRQDFIRTYLERDVPQFGPRIPAEALRRLWTMLAHQQGGLLNVSALARNLGVSGTTVTHYLDLMVDLLLVRRLPPWTANLSKRLVRSPKVYVRDSGLVHALLGLGDLETISGHPVIGASWEGFVVEQVLNLVAGAAQATFFRTAAGAEIDVVLDWPQGERWAIEVKRSASPRLTRGFHSGSADVQATRGFVVYAGHERFPMGPAIDAISLPELCVELQARAAG